MAMQPQNPLRHTPLRRLFVHVWVGDKPHVAGVIETSGDYWPPARRSSSFQYGRSWRERQGSFPIDPINLPLVPGPQQAPAQWQLHGAFEDTCPDGWGQLVIDLRYPDDNFGTIEYVAATSDDRVGFLGYSPAPNLPPQEMDAYGRPAALAQQPMPLAQLVEAAKMIENNEKLPASLEPYFQRGSSIGGARPKAAFTDNDGSLWIAKFGMSDDKFNNARVEAACLDMAEAAGIKTPERRLQMVGGETVLLVRRFDRITGEDGRLHRLGYLSAKTALGADDLYRTQYSYADLAAVARKFDTPVPDEVFRRMLLNVYVGNTDEHLKNHAFIRRLNGSWGLSPVFDVVPCPGKRSTVMRLGKGHAVDPEDAFSSHEKIGLRQDEAVAIRSEVEDVASRWREFMSDRGVSDEDIEVLTPAFAAAPETPTCTWTMK